jgi:hypothetical protein
MRHYRRLFVPQPEDFRAASCPLDTWLALTGAHQRFRRYPFPMNLEIPKNAQFPITPLSRPRIEPPCVAAVCW